MQFAVRAEISSEFRHKKSPADWNPAGHGAEYTPKFTLLVYGLHRKMSSRSVRLSEQEGVIMSRKEELFLRRALVALALVGVVCGGLTLWQVWRIIVEYTPLWAKLGGAVVANLAALVGWFREVRS